MNEKHAVETSPLNNMPASHMVGHSPCTGLDRPLGLQGVDPEFLDNRHMKVTRIAALRTGCLYPPEDNPGTNFFQRLSRPQGHSAT